MSFSRIFYSIYFTQYIFLLFNSWELFIIFECTNYLASYLVTSVISSLFPFLCWLDGELRGGVLAVLVVSAGGHLFTPVIFCSVHLLLRSNTTTSSSYCCLFPEWCHECALVWSCLWDVKFFDVLYMWRPYRHRKNPPLSLMFHNSTWFACSSLISSHVFLHIISPSHSLVKFRQEGCLSGPVG